MIIVTLSPSFTKNYSKRILYNKKLDFVFNKRAQQFAIDPNCQQLHNHRLIGKLKDLYSFSITGDIRVIYRWIDQNTVLFLDIGSHNQVY